MTIYFWWGQEEFNIEQRINELKNKLISPEFLSTNYKEFNNPDFYTLIEILSTPALMFGSLLSIIYCNDYFFNKRKDSFFDDKELKKLEEVLQFENSNHTIILCCKIQRNETKKIDTRKKLFKLIAKYTNVEEFPMYKPYDKALFEYIKKLAKQKEINLSQNVINLLVNSIGSNLRNLNNELEKLKLYKYPQTEITETDIIKLATPAENIFKLLDFYLEGRVDLALQEFKRLNEKQHPLITLSTLHTNLRQSMNIKIASLSKTPQEIARENNLHEYVIKLKLEKLKDFPFQKLVTLKNNLVKAELDIKTGRQPDVELAVETAFLY